ncbi:hypothetical protein [Prevotella sp.]|uniref:hypothetical protein n=1 Tax=Prevotella sp. TaxID=59823 RepID=UPI002F9585DC
MTKDVFNQERFRAYVAKLWAEQKRFAMTFCLILAGLIFAAELFAVFTCYHVPSYAVDNNMPAEDPIRNGIVVECLLLLFAGGCIAASRMLADGQQKAGRIHVLTQPVSMFENWLARVLIFVVGYFVAFHAIYYGFELVRVAIFSPVFPQSHISVQHLFSFAGSSDMFFPALFYSTVAYAFFVSFYTLGCFVFPRRPLLATTVALFCIGIALLFILLLYADPSEFFMEVMFVWGALLAGCNFWLSYRRLRELEIIDRM